MLQALLSHIEIADLVALGALVLSIFAAIRSGQAATVDAFDKLCKALLGRIDANDREIAALKAELAELRAENVTLRGRVRVLEAENAALKKQLDELQQKRRRARKGT